MAASTRAWLEAETFYALAAAHLIDIAIGFAFIAGSQGLVYLASGGRFHTALEEAGVVYPWLLLSASLPVWLYFTLLESAHRHATLGKWPRGLQVTTPRRRRPTVGRALARTAVKLVPFELTHVSLMLSEPIWSAADPGLRPGLISPTP